MFPLSRMFNLANRHIKPHTNPIKPLAAALTLGLSLGFTGTSQAALVSLTPIGTYSAGAFDEGAAEIVAYDAASQRLFVVNGDTDALDILDISDPTNPTKVGQISFNGGSPNSVAIKNGVVAAAVQNNNAQLSGTVQFFDTNGNFLGTTGVNAIPDSLAFSPDGSKLVVANEAEASPDGEDQAPNLNPAGSISIISLSQPGGFGTISIDSQIDATFEQFNQGGSRALDLSLAVKDGGIRINPNAPSVAADIEPEYVAISPDGTTAYVTLQEQNAVAVVDLATGTVSELLPLGVKDHSQADSGFISFDGVNNSSNGLDAIRNDDTIDITTQPVFGMFMPDAIATYEVNGQLFFVTANEGDTRDPEDFGDFDLGGLGDFSRLESANVDQAIIDAGLTDDDNSIGDLNISTIDGDTDGDGDIDEIYAFGTRSFSIFDANGNLVFDSGDDFEQITAAMFPNDFNSNNDENDSFEARSDDKGPEPEAVTIGQLGDITLAFIGLERIGGIMVYDISDPTNPIFLTYVNNRDFGFDGDLDSFPDGAGDLGVEGLIFISALDSPNGQALLVAANEISGTTTIFAITTAIPTPSALAMGFIGIAGLITRRRRNAA